MSEGFRVQPSGFATKAIHVGQDPEQWNSMAVIPPITTSTTFKQDGPGEHRVSFFYVEFHQIFFFFIDFFLWLICCCSFWKVLKDLTET